MFSPAGEVTIEEKFSQSCTMQDNTLSADSSLASMSAENLLVAVGNQADRQAFSQLFKLYSGKIFSLGMKRMRNEQLARDLVQEAMLSVWQKASLYDVDKGNAQSWIFTLARNRCFDMLRKQQRQPSCVSADDIWPTGEMPADNDDIDEQLESIEKSQMKQLYEQLPDAQRDVVVQLFVQGKTHQETAQALNIPLGTVKSRLRLALDKLKKELGSVL